MTAAIRLWWLLRSTSDHPRDGATSLAFGLVTWSLLSGLTLLGMARAGAELERALLLGLGALVVALALTAVAAVMSLTRRRQDRRLTVLRSAGATHGQTTLVCALEVADSALPGVVVALLAHVALWWGLGGIGVALPSATPLLVAPWLILAVLTATVVASRVRAALG